MAARLQFLQSLSISVGMAFATSCFAMVAGMAGRTGPWVVPAIGISMLIVLTVAQAIATLAKRFPSALGIRTYIKAAFGDTASLFCVFLYMFMIALVAGVESNMFAGIVRYVFPSLDAQMILGGVFVLVATMNVLGCEFSKRAQLVLAATLLTAVLALAVCSLAHAGLAAGISHRASGAQLPALPPAVIAGLFLFVGFEWVTSASSGSRSAAKQLPAVLVTAVLLLGIVYMIFAAAVVANLDAATLARTDKPQMLLAQQLWGTYGKAAVLGISCLTVVTSFNAGVLGASRMLYALAREGVLPRAVGTTAPLTGAPVAAIVLATAVSLGSALAALKIHDNYLLSNVAAVSICICYCGLLAASLKLDQTPLAVKSLWSKRAAQSIALLLMAALMLALLFYAETVLEAAIVLVSVGSLLPLAVLANRRAVRARVATRGVAAAA
jgi:amino acid transporter